MKKLLSSFALAVLIFSLYGITNGRSIFFADSYMLRAHGVEASYWNPAKLAEDKYIDLWIPLSNSGIYIANNALDLETYNNFVSADTLYAADKEELLSKVDGSIRAVSSGSMSLWGFTMGNTALSSSVCYYGKGALSEKFLRLVLYGNTEDEYVFERQDNNISVMSFADVTYGFGDIKIPFIPESVPDIKIGFSASVLTGLYNVSTEDYKGVFSSDDNNGASIQQDIRLRAAVGGYGFKGMFGMYSQVSPHVEVGMTLDNIGGNINWNLVKEDLVYHFEADSVYVANLQEDLYTQTHSRTKAEAFKTVLPPEFRVAWLYHRKRLSLSADWVQGFKTSVVTSGIGRLSFATQVLPLPFLPISWGLSFGNSAAPMKVSYGAGIKTKTLEVGAAIQSYGAFFPGQTSKGISAAFNLRVWY